MRILHPIFCVALFAGSLLRVEGQMDSDDPNNPATPPAGATVVTSDELRMDQAGHVAVFTGNVIVVGSNFKMNCEEMTVYFTTDSKVDHIIAKDNVVIVQPERVTHCGQADYYRDEDKFVLTEEPTILDNKNQISAPEITIFRTKQSLLTKGRTRTVIIQGMGASATAPDTTGQH
jgi:lipopolysaccharide transport protein LptA